MKLCKVDIQFQKASLKQTLNEIEERIDEIIKRENVTEINIVINIAPDSLVSYAIEKRYIARNHDKQIIKSVTIK